MLPNAYSYGVLEYYCMFNKELVVTLTLKIYEYL